MNIEDEPPHNYCNECGHTFDSSFELIRHYLSEGEDFNPYYLLPNGFKLLLGSLLECLYDNAGNSKQIELITQSTYVTLFASEMGYELVDELIEDMVVKSALHNFDKELNDLLIGEPNEEEFGE